jgi:hypothetical protein
LLKRLQLLPESCWRCSATIPAEVRATYGAGLLEPLDEADRAFSYGPVTGGSALPVQWKSLPSDLRAFVETNTIH